MEAKLCPHCQTNKPLSEFHSKINENRLNSWCKTCVYARQSKRWTDRKLKAVELMGGKCQKCGYDKNYGALQFHHLNPEDKEYNWAKLKFRPWKIIINELSKCILLCANCHAETHHPHCILNYQNLKDNDSLNEKEKEVNPLVPTGTCLCGANLYVTKFCSTLCRSVDKKQKSITPTGKCFCGKDVFGSYTFCSNSCRAYSQRRVIKPTKEELEHILKTEKTYMATARKFGISDNTVHKWAKEYGLK
jgi:hypothetical protein